VSTVSLALEHIGSKARLSLSMAVVDMERCHALAAAELTAEEESSPEFVTAEECMRPRGKMMCAEAAVS
jgi:hypothetical protein